jgi:hypothetical protein
MPSYEVVQPPWLAAAMAPIQESLDRIEARLDRIENKSNRLQRVAALVEFLLFPSYTPSMTNECSCGTKTSQ